MIMKGKKPYVVVFVIQTIYAAMFLLSKAAFDHGMNNFIFVFYRQALATIFLIPFAFIFEWKIAPPLSFRTFCKIFFLSLFGITLSLDINGIGLIYTSPTLAAATTNCLPVITFFLALILRVESLKIKTRAGIAKLIGIVACLAGASTLAFYKGPHLKLLSHHILGSNKQHDQSHIPSSTWIKGCFLMLLSNTLFGLWMVLQGIIVTGVTYYLMTWVIEKKGPVFLAMSTPLALIITIFSSVILLGDIISLGSVLGGFLLIVGLYSVLWGKNREQTPKVSQDLEQPSV
ncbi:WAT1-related protein At5g64700-like isoform X3 [Trifolium pratense]|uniref:WAT1-related protein At5g64700-like isoform X3 n=1 Tax=Trifolium pratense TaxID=57577 RepID=UPI001E698029|nr:WAT1-related protein At5g64700-like isoform X3 [Trifolium pratense]